MCEPTLIKFIVISAESTTQSFEYLSMLIYTHISQLVNNIISKIISCFFISQLPATPWIRSLFCMQVCKNWHYGTYIKNVIQYHYLET
jgi:hypothetical protein